MNLLAKTEQLWSKCVKDSLARSHTMESLGMPFDWLAHANTLWAHEIERIKTQLAPKYFELEEALRSSKIIKEKCKNIEFSGKWVLITLRPEEGAINLHRFIYDVNVLAQKPLFIEGEWVFEQCGDNEESVGKGFHSHLLMNCKAYVNVKDITTACGFIKYNCIIQVGSKKGQKFIRTDTDFVCLTVYMLHIT